MFFADLHCDTLYEIYKRGVSYNDDSLSVLYSAFGLFDKHIRNYAIYLENGKDDPIFLYEKMLDIYNEIKPSLEKSGVTPLLSVEGGALAEKGYSLEKMKSDGVKIMSLAWNFDNSLAGGSGGVGGISEKGFKIISEMNEQGIALDLSHLNKKSFYDAINKANTVLATHSNLREVSDHSRNITLDQAKLISQKQGLIGICFYPEFLGKNVFEAIYKNIFLMLDAGLENSIAIGSDFDGATMSDNLKTIADIPALYEFLLDKIGDKGLLDKIFYKNAMIFLDKLLTNRKL